MKGNSIQDFINDLYYNSEKELSFRNRIYLIDCYIEHEDYVISVAITDDGVNEVFKVKSKERSDCVNAFEKAKIFDGLNIYEAEREIEVIFG